MQLERNGNNKLLEYAYKLLSKKEYSSYFLKEKLVLKGASEIEAKEIVNHLIEKGYLNDDKLLSDIISRDNAKLYGKYKILTQLKKYHLVTSDLNDRFPEEIELEKAKQLVSELEDKSTYLSSNSLTNCLAFSNSISSGNLSFKSDVTKWYFLS